MQFESLLSGAVFFEIEEIDLALRIGTENTLEVEVDDQLVFQGTEILELGEWYLIYIEVGAGDHELLRFSTYLNGEKIEFAEVSLSEMTIPSSITYQWGYVDSALPVGSIVLDEWAVLNGSLEEADLLEIDANAQAEEIGLRVIHSTGEVGIDRSVYLFDSHRYTGVGAITDEAGNAILSTLALERLNDYQLRIDWLGEKFWTYTFPLPGISLYEAWLPSKWVELEVNVQSDFMENVPVYLFSENNKYLGIKRITDENGLVRFLVPDDTVFKIRADYLGQKYWLSVDSGELSTSQDFNLGGGYLDVFLTTDADFPLENYPLYLFSNTKKYLGKSEMTDINGKGSFLVSDGIYQLRTNLFGYEFWSDPVTVGSDANLAFNIPFREVEVTINKVHSGDIEAMGGVKSYVFNETNKYIGLNQTTNEFGIASYYLPNRPYKVRADYLNGHYWSELSVAEDIIIEIPHSTVELSLTHAGEPLADAKVYVFDSNQKYLKINSTTNEEGSVFFSLPEGTYQMRVDYLMSKFWSNSIHIQDDVLVDFEIEHANLQINLTGGGRVLENTRIYVFNTSGQYLGIHKHTDANGEVNFILPAKEYLFRVDTHGAKYWTDSIVLNSGEQVIHDFSAGGGLMSITISANGSNLSGVKVYVFNESDRYLGFQQTSDENGLVEFNLTEGHYKFRIDFEGEQYWTELTEVVHEEQSLDYDLFEFTDSDQDGLPDFWEMTHFGNLEQGTNDDFDGDGLSNIEEYNTETDPEDFFNGDIPVINVLVGSQNVAESGFTAWPFEVQVLNSNGLPLGNAPVLFNVEGGYAGLTTEATTEGLSQSSLEIRTDTFGRIHPAFTPIYFKGTSPVGSQFEVQLTSGGAEAWIVISVIAGEVTFNPPRQVERQDNGDGSVTYSWAGDAGDAAQFFIEEQNQSGEWVKVYDESISVLPEPDPDTGRYSITITNE